MSGAYETFEHNGFTVNIHPDHGADSPDEWGDEGVFLVAFHRQFSVERDGISKPEHVVWYWPKERIVQHLIEEQGYEPADAADEAESGHVPGYEVFPLQAYIHGGVALSLGDFSCPWDSGQVGWVLVKLTDVGDGRARECAEGLVGAWNQHLSGDVWGYVITDSAGEEVEDGSCWGFYGLEECIEEAKRRCPGSGEAREVVVKVLYAVYVPGKWPSHPVNGGVWDTRTLTVPLAVGDGQVPAFLMADTARWDPSGLQVDSVYVAGEADDA